MDCAHHSPTTLQPSAGRTRRLGGLLVHDGRLGLSVVIAAAAAGPKELLVLRGIGVVDHDCGGGEKGVCLLVSNNDKKKKKLARKW